MNIVDLLILAALVGSAFHGFFRGAAVQLCSFLGFCGGLLLGAAIAPLVTGHLNSPLTKSAAAMVIVFGLAIVLGGVGERVGSLARKSLRTVMLGPVDSAVGAVTGVLGALLAVWLISAMLLAVGNVKSISQPISQSAIVQVLQRTLPPATAVAPKIGSFLTPKGLPPLFANLVPPAPVPLPAPADPAVAGAVDAAGPSTVKIQGYGCGGIKDGSGFIAAPGIVVTNAHVVSGIALPEVYTRTGRRYADTTVVVYDPDVDLAVLRVNGLVGKALPLVRTDLPRATVGAVIGYPGGGPFTSVPGAILGEANYTGQNIYGQGITTRSIYEIQADVRPGNSGGPFVTRTGAVAGVVFSSSVSLPNVGYALSGKEVAPDIALGESRTAAVKTGDCAG